MECVRRWEKGGREEGRGRGGGGKEEGKRRGGGGKEEGKRREGRGIEILNNNIESGRGKEEEEG